MSFDSFLPALLGNRLLSSIVLVATVVALRLLVVRLIRGSEVILSGDRRTWLVRVRNLSLIAALIGLVLIWLPSLHTFALSVTAFAVALVIATKELILCLSGGFLRSLNRAFEIGDWVEIGEHRGEVVDATILTTTLQEVGGPVGRYEYSGKTITLPNSVFLSMPVHNENFFKKWVFLDVAVVLEADVDMTAALAEITPDVDRLFSPYAETAQRFTAAVERRSGIDIAEPQPRVTIRTTDIGKQRIVVTLFCPTPQAYEMERSINSIVLGHYWRRRNAVAADERRPVARLEG